ncbi:hypothetical protein BKA83DRAFT_4210376, partial [Pisolithus microcarpus]
MTPTCLCLSSPDRFSICHRIFHRTSRLGRPGSDLVHPDEFPVVRQLHYGTPCQDKAVVL